MLLGRERRDRDRGNARKAEPVFTCDFLERLEDFVADTEVDVEFHECPTIETGVNREPSAALWRLIEFGHRLTDNEREEVWQPHSGCELKALPQRYG